MSVVLDNGVIAKHAGGRPPKYKPEYCDLIIEHFRVPAQTMKSKKTYYADGTIKSEEEYPVATDLPTFQNFADSIGVHMSQLTRWQDEYEEFRTAYARAKQLQEHIWLVNGMSNLYNSQFAQFFGKNCLGYSDKQSIELTGAEGGPILLQSVNALSDDDLLRLEEIMAKAQIQGEVVDIESNE